MTPIDAAAALALWVLVAVLPGLLVAAGLRPGAGWLRNLLVAPLLTLGLLMAVAVPFTAAGVAVNALTTLLPVYLVALVCLSARMITTRRAPRPVVFGTAAWLWMAGVCGAALAVWMSATEWFAMVPPNDDGSNHGLFATQIMALETVEPDRVVVGDVVSGQPSSPYYPLALHLAAALISRLGSLPVASTLTVQMVMGAAVLLPLGSAVLTRRLYPRARSAPAVAALLAVMFAMMPYYVSTWGGFPFILGMALLPIAVDALAGAGRDSGWLASGAIAGLVLVGLFALHSSEMVTAALLAVALVVGATMRREVRVAQWLLPAVTAGGLLLAFIAVQARQVLTGAGNVAVAALQQPESATSALWATLTFLTDFPNPDLVGSRPPVLVVWHALSGLALLALVAVGVIVSVRRRLSPEWAVALGVVAAACVLSGMRLVDLATVPWYSRFDRVAMNLLPIVVPLAALGVAVVAERVSRARVAVSAGAIAAAVAAPQLAVAAQVAHSAYSDGSLAGPDQRAAFAFLSQRVQAGERVLNDAADGSCWMWTLDGVAPLFAVAPHQIPGWGDRLELLRRAPEVATDPAVGAIARQWQVRYAYVGPQTFRGRPHANSVASMVAGAGWRIVFQRGEAVVLERVG